MYEVMVRYFVKGKDLWAEYPDGSREFIQSFPRREEAQEEADAMNRL